MNPGGIFRFVLLLVLTIVLSCKDGLKRQARDVVAGYVGATVVFPDSLVYRTVEEGACPLPQKPLKLIVYINGECGACMKQFADWSQVVCQYESQGDVDVVFYVRAMDAYAIIPHLRRINFKYPFFIDPKSDILYLNRISESQTLLHTFLADRDNRTVLIGSPVGNPKLSELYRRQIRELSGE